jgi:C4-dicarboxylate-specific signal transduction histidine kinase
LNRARGCYLWACFTKNQLSQNLRRRRRPGDIVWGQAGECGSRADQPRLGTGSRPRDPRDCDGELAAAIAHEVNQPLTAIVTNGQFCLRQLDDVTSNPDEVRAAIREIVNDANLASAVISRIRGLLSKAVPTGTELNINQIIQDVTILLRHEFTRYRVSLRTELVSDLPRLPGDPVQLQQVLINLIMNAIEATIWSTDGRREILIRSSKNPDGVLVQVQDSGPGIEPGLANRIFAPFFTTKANGIGMGLSISHSIIKSHRGRLRTVPKFYRGAVRIHSAHR